MKFDLTRQTFTQTLFFSSLVILLYWGGIFVNADSINMINEQSVVMPTGKWLDNFVQEYNQLGIIITILFQLFNALYLSRIFTRNVIYTKHTHVASMLFILITISSPLTNQELTSQLTTSLSLFALEGVLNIKKRVNSTRNFFLSSSFVSVAGLIYLPAAAVFICIISIFFIYNRFNFREFLASIGGFLIPPFFYSYYLWIIEKDFFSLSYTIIDNIKSNFSIISIEKILSMNIFNVIFIVVITIIMLYSLIIFIINRQITRSKTIYSYALFWVLMVVILTISMLFTSTMTTIVPLYSVAASVILSYLFNKLTHRVVTNIIFVVLVIITILANII